MSGNHYGSFDFDELDTICQDGWTLRSAYKGKARVDKDGEIVEIYIRAVSPKGQATNILIEPDDPLYAGLKRGLIADYFAHIEDAAADLSDEYQAARKRQRTA